MKLITIIPQIILVAVPLLTCSCGSIRTEFYRGETKYQYNFANQLYKQGEYGSAQAAIEQILALDPNYGPAHAALGTIAFIQGDCKAALIHYKTAIRVDPHLEVRLRPNIRAAAIKSALAPLEKPGVRIRKVYQLMMADDRSKIETLFMKDFPLELLAQDTLSITPIELDELSNRVATNLTLDDGWSVRCRLFGAYFLFYNHTKLDFAAALIDSAVAEAENLERRVAYEILGQIHEKMGDLNLAVDAYVLAKNAGLSNIRVSRHLSRIYGPIELNLDNEEHRQADSPTPTTVIELSVPTNQHKTH